MPTFNFDFTEFYNGLVSLTKRIADTIYHVKDNSIEAKYLSLITLLKDRPNLRNSSEIEKTDKLIQENLGAIREVYNSNKKHAMSQHAMSQPNFFNETMYKNKFVDNLIDSIIKARDQFDNLTIQDKRDEIYMHISQITELLDEENNIYTFKKIFTRNYHIPTLVKVYEEKIKIRNKMIKGEFLSLKENNFYNNYRLNNKQNAILKELKMGDDISTAAPGKFTGKAPEIARSDYKTLFSDGVFKNMNIFNRKKINKNEHGSNYVVKIEKRGNGGLYATSLKKQTISEVVEGKWVDINIDPKYMTSTTTQSEPSLTLPEMLESTRMKSFSTAYNQYIPEISQEHVAAEQATTEGFTHINGTPRNNYRNNYIYNNNNKSQGGHKITVSKRREKRKRTTKSH